MPKTARIPITNIYMGGDYTGRILVGPHKKPMNVILDTGSSALALDGHRYHPDLIHGDEATRLAQSDSYGDGSSWTGAVINSTVAVGDGASQIVLTGANVGVAYDETANMFEGSDGILGLAYAELDDAYQMADVTWPKKYSSTQVRTGKHGDIVPYLTQLAQEDVIFDKFSFYTKRSFVHEGGGGANDPLNQGWMILGGGEEATDLYSGAFQTAKILADEWYNTNLKAIIVGNSTPIHVPKRGQQGSPSNSIVDSGTNSLNIGPRLLKSVLSKFNSDQQHLLTKSIMENRLVAVSDLDLNTWPDITCVLQGEADDILLKVKPADYWQVNTSRVGAAVAAITVGDDGMAILGLPLMNGYFTVFDGEADGGKGVIKFATRK